MPYLEADITDACNLKCKACYHFANFSLKEEFYPLEIFRQDIRQVARICDILTFRLLGGEPFILKNIDKYIEVVRRSLPKATLRILSNGLLIPALPQKIFDSLRENNVAIDISGYLPTLKIADRIKASLEANNIPYRFVPTKIEKFNVFLTLNGNNNPFKSRQICGNEFCRTMRNGKIYKCPLDAFSYKLAEKFGIENFPQSAGIDICAPNFPSLIQMLDGNVEMCYWCSEKARQISWETATKPKLEDWLADPDEIKNFL